MGHVMTRQHLMFLGAFLDFTDLKLQFIFMKVAICLVSPLGNGIFKYLDC